MTVAVLEQPSFFVTGGTLPPAAPSYIRRSADRDLLQFMAEGEFCYVLNARQMGKSSLSVRTMAQLNERGIRTVFIDLTKLGGRNVTADQWYAGLLAELGRALGLRQEFVKYFVENKEVGAMQRFFGALREVGLEQIQDPICIFIDEVDATRALSFSADEFFAGIRECYNRRVLDPEYKRLTFCLLGVASPSDLIQDVRTTPFNIGKNIRLSDFTLDEALQLEEGLGKNAGKVLERVLYWTDGHPYLTQNLCAAVVQRGLASATEVDHLVHETFFEKRARMGHVNLADVANRVLNGFDSPERIDAYRAEILQLYAQIRSKRKRVPDDSSNRLQTILRLSGLVRVDDGQLRPRNRIYETVFDTDWIEENMPGVELRRQKRAYRLGILRAASVGAVIVVAMAVLAGYSMVLAKKARDSEGLANYELYVANVELMETAWEENNIDRVRELLKATQNEVWRGWEWHFWNRLANLEVLAVEDEEFGYGPSYSPNGKEIVMRYRTKMSFFDSTSGKLLRSFKMPRPSMGFAVWSPDGKRVLDPATDEGLFVYDAESGREMTSVPAKQHTTSLRPFSPDGRYFVSSPSDFSAKSHLTVWDADTGKLHRQIDLPGQVIQGATFSPDGHVLAGLEWPRAGGRYGAFVFDLDTSKVRREFPTQGLPTSVLFSPDGKFVAVSESNGWLEVFDANTGKRTSFAQTNGGTVSQIDWTRDGRFIGSVGSDRLCRVYSFSQGKIEQINAIKGAGLINFSPDGQHILAGYFDLKVYETFTRDESTRHSLPTGLTGRIRLEPSGKLSFLDAGLIRALDPAFLASPLPNGLNDNGFVSDDGKYLLLGEPHGEWDLVRANEWKSLMKLKGLKSPPAQVNVSANGDRASIVFDNRSIAVYEVRTGNMIRIFDQERFTAADLSPDGRVLLTGNLWGDVKFWNVDLGSVAHHPKGHRRTVTSVTFSERGSKAITTSDDDTAIVWDTDDGTQQLVLDGHSQTVLGANFSPDMTRIVTASRDLTARLWDARTGRELLVLDGHQGEVLSAQFTPDGRKIVTSGADGRAHVWSAEQWAPSKH
jgi:WD40 repeat protein